MSFRGVAAGPGYFRPLSEAQKRALRIICAYGDIHAPWTNVRVNTVNSLLELGLVEWREIPEGIGADGVSKSRHAIVLSRLAEVIRVQWGPA